MSEVIPIADSESLVLQLFSMFNNDVAAVSIAKEFVGLSSLKFQLLQMSIGDATAHAGQQLVEGATIDYVVVANRAVQLAKNKLTAFS